MYVCCYIADENSISFIIWGVKRTTFSLAFHLVMLAWTFTFSNDDWVPFSGEHINDILIFFPLTFSGERFINFLIDLQCAWKLGVINTCKLMPIYIEQKCLLGWLIHRLHHLFHFFFFALTFFFFPKAWKTFIYKW